MSAGQQNDVFHFGKTNNTFPVRVLNAINVVELIVHTVWQKILEQDVDCGISNITDRNEGCSLGQIGEDHDQRKSIVERRIKLNAQSALEGKRGEILFGNGNIHVGIRQGRKGNGGRTKSKSFEQSIRMMMMMMMWQVINALIFIWMSVLKKRKFVWRIIAVNARWRWWQWWGWGWGWW